MGDNGGLSASDVALMSNNGWGNDGMGLMWLLAIILLMGGGNFGFGGNGYRPQYATQDFVQNGFNFNDLQNQNRDIVNAITNGTAQAVAATNQAKYDNINVMKDVQAALASQIADVRGMEQSILGNQNECCCSTKMLIAEQAAGTNAMIAQSKYDTSVQMAQMEARLTAKMDANEIQSLRDQVSQLQMAQATAGMLRFPNSWSYGAGPFPPFQQCCQGNV